MEAFSPGAMYIWLHIRPVHVVMMKNLVHRVCLFVCLFVNIYRPNKGEGRQPCSTITRGYSSSICSFQCSCAHDYVLYHMLEPHVLYHTPEPHPHPPFGIKQNLNHGCIQCG